MSQDTQSDTPVPVSFAQFLVSLGSSALVNLGEIADPGTGKKSQDLAIARHSIDVLVLLKEKTNGNLDADETRLLDALISDLNAKYTSARN